MESDKSLIAIKLFCNAEKTGIAKARCACLFKKDLHDQGQQMPIY